MQTNVADMTSRGERRWLIGREATAPFLAVLLTLHVLAFGYQVLTASSGLAGDGDVRRMQEIASAPGVPYRDVVVEYAPVELIVIETLASPSLVTTARRLTALSLLADLATFGLFCWGWGRRVAGAYLLVSLPLLPIMVARIDPLVVALVVASFAALRRTHDRSGGWLLAVGCLAKLWPLVIVPALLIEGRHRATRWFSATFAAGVGAWLAVGGVDGVRQVLTFRGATGWQIESTVGAIVHVTTGGPTRFEAGAQRVGVEPGWARIVLPLVLAAIVVAVWRHARDWRGSLEGDPSLAVLGALLALAPVFSVQYACWLTPWLAIAGTEDENRTMPRVGFAIILLTTALLPIYLRPGIEGWTVPVTQTILIARGLACLALPIIWLRRRTA
jgi:hypothetical protein